MFKSGHQIRPPKNATLVRKRPSLEFSVTGLAYCTMMMFMGIAANGSQANLLFGVFGLMMGILLVSGIISKLMLRKLSVQRIVPEHGTVGQPIALVYEMSNGKRYWPSMSVTVAELDAAEAFTRQPQAYMLHATAKTTSEVSAEVIAKRRGIHHFNRYQMITSFPFGFIKRAVERSHAETLVIYPAIGRVDPRVIQMCRSAETSGAMMRPRRGGNDEFYGVKEYRAGENPRWIYWRRSARTGTLVSKEMTHVSPPRMLMLVDTYLRDQSIESHAAVERVIAMAASLASEAIGLGLPLGMLAWSGGDWLRIAPNRGKRHRRDVLSALARLSANSDHTQRELLEEGLRQQKSGTTAILFTPAEIRLSRTDVNRGNLIVLAANSPGAQRFFNFDKTVDFAGCVPVEIQEKLTTEA